MQISTSGVLPDETPVKKITMFVRVSYEDSGIKFPFSCICPEILSYRVFDTSLSL